MKTCLIVFCYALIGLTPTFGQGPTEFTPPMAERGVSVYINDNGKSVLWLDNFEALLMPCESATAEAEKPLSLLIFGRKWNVQSEFIKLGLIYLIPEGQDMQTWSEAIAILRVDSRYTTPALFQQQLMRIREKNCPGKTYYANILTETKNSMIYETKSEQCGEFPAQSEIKKILTPHKIGAFFQFTVWVVEYTTRDGDFAEDQRVEAQNWLESIRLAKGKEIKILTKHKPFTAL